jgi:uncharacterized protein
MTETSLYRSPPPQGPTPQTERIRSIDVLRGFALLGILAVNIQVFAMIDAVLFNPTAYGDFTGANRLVWIVTHLFFDQKFMTIFSMLFGAGILLLSDRVQARGGSPAVVHYSRAFWLIVFGLLHGYLLWFGDILYLYGVCALAVFLFRKLPPAWLIGLGLASIAVASVLFCLFGLSMQFWSPADLESLAADFKPGAEAVRHELEVYRSDWAGQVVHRAPEVLAFQTFIFAIWGGWRAGGLMLVGMGLYRLGLFSAKLRARAYATMVGGGVFIGLPVVGYGIARYERAEWSAEYSFFLGSQFNYWGSLLVSLGWVGLVMLVCRRSVKGRLLRSLGAVGQTALSNYILQTLICTTLFYGQGFGLFGYVDRVGQVAIVVVIWAVQLLVAPWWLHRFRFGPMEWLWRTLTYRRRQPFLRTWPV